MLRKVVLSLAIAVLFCASVQAVTDYTVGFSSDVSTNSLNTNGFSFTPSVQGSGSGLLTVSDVVRINYIDVLFYGGSGVKDNVTSVNRSLALFTEIATVAPENVASTAVGNVVIPWASAIATGSSNIHTWIRYDFSGIELLLDQDTKYAVAFIADNGYAFGSGVNYKATGVRITSNTYAGGAVINSTPSENLTYDTLFNISLTPVPEPATVALLGLGALAIIHRRKR